MIRPILPISILLLILGTTGIYLFYFHDFSDYVGTPKNVPFNKTVWQNGTWQERGGMIKYLTDSIGIIGKSRTELRTIMGKPDRTFFSPDNDSVFVFVVDPGVRWPPDDMMIFFDSTGYAIDIFYDD